MFNSKHILSAANLFVFLVAFFFSLQSFALSTDWQRDEAVDIRLITGTDGTGDEKSFPVGLDLNLHDGWHTYWRTPGDAGLPPQLDWMASQNEAGNVQDAVLQYPAPHRYTAYGLETIGYENHVILPILITPRAVGQAVTLKPDINLVVCSSVCVPKHYVFSLTIPSGPATKSAEADDLSRFQQKIPKPDLQSGLSITKTGFDGKALTVEISATQPLVTPDLFIESNGNLSFSAPKTMIASDRLHATLSLQALDTLPDGKTLAGMPLTVTLVDNDRALETAITVPPLVKTASVTHAPTNTPSLSLFFALLLAFGGGLILNLMPCVLPVLSLKMLSVARHGGGETRHVRTSFLLTASGILCSFLVLALTTIILKSLGKAVGWGVQFQQPIFLTFLIAVLTLFTANLWGLFEIPLPRFLADRADPVHHPKLAGDFATGALATLLATPCSAPFLGTAVGFALSAGPLVIAAVFLALGIGMATPYFVIAAWPRFATRLPKPGRWMLRLKAILGGALAVTALWLCWVLSMQVTLVYAAGIIALMVCLVVALALMRHIQGYRITVGALVLIAAAFILAATSPSKTSHMIDNTNWKVFDQKDIAVEIASGKTVFVDITADWCLTCKANERLTLSQDKVKSALLDKDLIAMRGDWTRPDPVLADFMRQYGRYGIPFNAVYGPAAPEGIILPELLSPEIVLNAIKKAGGP